MLKITAKSFNAGFKLCKDMKMEQIGSKGLPVWGFCGNILTEEKIKL